MISAKELKRLAAACRKAGISHLKTDAFEFTLSESLPQKPSKPSSKAPISAASSSVSESSSLTPDDLLFWSSGLPEHLTNEPPQ